MEVWNRFKDIILGNKLWERELAWFCWKKSWLVTIK
jgi:hypothetical protein